MKKIIALGLSSLIILSSCGTEVVQTKEEKKPFQVSVKSVEDFTKGYTKDKSGRLVGSSTIALTSQGVGRVTSIAVKEGATVKKGQLLVSLTDTTANYGIRQNQAENTVKTADVNIASTKLTLDKAVDDAKNALARAESSYNTTKRDSEKQLEKSRRDAAKAVVSSTGSDAQIALSKAELDFENLKKSNITTISNYQSTYTLTISDLQKLLQSVRFDADKILGVSDANRGTNDPFEIYISAKDPSYKTKAEALWGKLADVDAFLASKKDLQVNETNLITELSLLSSSYTQIREFLNTMGTMFENSISSQTLPQTQLDGYVTLFNGYKSSLSGLETGFAGFKSGANTFLSNYKNNEASAAAALEVQRKNLATGEFEATLGLDRTKLSLTNGVEQARLAYESAKSAYQNAIDTRRVTLEKLQVSRTDAVLALEQANKEVAKLAIVSPIDATVTHVVTSVGQDVSTGTPVIELASNTPEIVFDLDAESVALLKIGSNEKVEYDGKTYTGTVVGVSQVANDSLLYTARVVLPVAPKYLGGIATIKLSLQSKHLMLPNEMIKVISESKGELNVLSGATIATIPVDLGESIGKSVEIITPLDPKTELITSDVSNFDERKFTIEVK